MGYLTHVDCKEVRSSGTDVRVPSCRELKLTVRVLQHLQA